MTRYRHVWISGHDPGVWLAEVDPPLAPGEVDLSEPPRPTLSRADQVALADLFNESDLR